MMKRPCQNSASNNVLTLYPVKAPECGFLKRALIVLFSTLLLLGMASGAQAAVTPPAFIDGDSVAIGTSATTLAQLDTTFAAGNNFVIAAVQLNSTVSSSISAGNLLLQRVGGPTLMSNQYEINYTSSLPHSQRWYVLTGIDTGAGASVSYAVTATANATGINGEAKIVAIEGVTGREIGTQRRD